MSFPEAFFELYDEYHKYNHKLYLVGGAVRDMILNMIPNDYDFATDALPNETIKILNRLNWRVNRDNEKFGVIIAIINEIKIEITTFRKDNEQVRRLCEVELAIGIEEDSKRRDITYNSIYYDIKTKEIIDYNNGVNDLDNGIIRMIGDPNRRISEDPSRILRIIRYSCKYNHTIDEKIIMAIRRNISMTMSKGKISEEVLKSFFCCNFNKYLSQLNDLNLTQYIFPNLTISHDHEIITKYIEIFFAYIFRNNDDINKKLRELKYNNKICERTLFLIEMINFNPLLLTEYITRKRKYFDNNQILAQWVELMNLGEMQLKLINYKSIINNNIVNNLIENGYTGQQLKDELKLIEYNNFLLNL